MGSRVFSKFQFGKETDRGTAVAADTVLIAAPMALPVDRKWAKVTGATGLRAQVLDKHVDEYLVRDTLRFDADHPLYYQALPLLFSCGLQGGLTVAEQTAGQSDYLWTFAPALTSASANVPDTVTLEMGDDTQAFEMEYLMFERLRISGQISQDGDASAVTCEADFFARQISTTTWTASLALPSYEVINSKLARFYIDTAWAGLGGTEKSGLLRSFDLEILFGTHPKFGGSANKYFDTHGEGAISWMLQCTLEGDANADAIYDAMVAGTYQAVRIGIQGTKIGSTKYQLLQIDLGGTWDEVVPLGGEANGNNLHTAVMSDEYNATSAKIIEVAVSTNVAAL